MKKALRIATAIAGLILIMALAVGCGSKTQVNSGDNARPGQGNRAGRAGMFNQRSPEETKTLLAPLVQDKTITQQQADTVAAYTYKQASDGRWSDQSPGQGQGPNQGDRLNQGQRPSPLSELVKNGTITQQQSDKITEVLFAPRGAGQTNVQ